METELHFPIEPKPELENKLVKAVRYVYEFINSKDFVKTMCKHEFQGSECFADTADNNVRVASKVVDATRTHFNISFFTSRKRILGYAHGDELFFNETIVGDPDYLIGDLAANIAHEIAHKAGYSHCMDNHWTWAYTVPYALGLMVKEKVNKEEGRLNLIEVDSIGLNHMSKLRYYVYRFLYSGN